MEREIVEYLKEKYQPCAILLHGSRAIGKERPESDWDFVLLFKKGGKSPGDVRFNFKGANIEVMSAFVPVKQEEILGIFDTKLQYSRVCWEEDFFGSNLLNDAGVVYRKGYMSPATFPDGPNLWFQGRVDGMRETVEEPLLFYRYFANFYNKAVNGWFQFLHMRYSQPFYLALPEIKEKDPQYYDLLEKFVSDISLPEKAEIAESIRRHLFGDRVSNSE